MAKTRGRDQRGPMERLVKIAAYLKLAGEQGAPSAKLIEIAGFEGENAQRLLTRELGHLLQQRWPIHTIRKTGNQPRSGSGTAGTHHPDAYTPATPRAAN